jgi:hypothetical protein
MLYELRPDVFPAGYLTPDEIDLWEIFYEDREQRRGGSAKNG